MKLTRLIMSGDCTYCMHNIPAKIRFLNTCDHLNSIYCSFLLRNLANNHETGYIKCESIVIRQMLAFLRNSVSLEYLKNNGHD